MGGAPLLAQHLSRNPDLLDAGRAWTGDALAGLEEARESVSSLGTAPRGLVRVTAPVDLEGARALGHCCIQSRARNM